MHLLLPSDQFCSRDPRLNATLQLRSKMSILRYLKPVIGNSLPTPDEAGLSASIIKEINQSGERAVVSNRRAPDNGAKGKCDRKYAAENGNAAGIKRFKASHEIWESTVRLLNKRYRLRTNITKWVWSNVARIKPNYKFAIYLKNQETQL